MILVTRALSEEQIQQAYKVRRKVFVEEQGIAENIVFDGFDKNADHFVASIEGIVVGSLRVRYPDSVTAKIERLAVLPAARGAGVATELMEFVLNYLKNKDIRKAVLDSQSYVRKLYEELGFSQVGDEFQEAGIPHVKMEKVI